MQSRSADKDELDKLERSPPQWRVLCVKYYNQHAFLKHTMNALIAGSFRFRLRYHTALQGWSEFSDQSPLCGTLCDVPAAPAAPTCLAITVEIRWTAPHRDHGSCVEEFLLVGKSAGDDEFHALYRGAERHFLLLGVFPEFVYTFQQ